MSCSSASKCQLWTDHGNKQAIIHLLLDDASGNASRPELPCDLWRHIASFLRFPSPMQMVYVFGGRHAGENDEEYFDTAEVFDWWRGDWVSLPSMSSARVGGGATVLDNRIIVAGGYSKCPTSPLSTVEAYDPFSQEWQMLPPMLTRRYGLALVTVNGKVFAIGGDNGRRVCSANEVYDPQLGCWRKVASLPTPLAGGKAEVHAGKIYYVGGCDDTGFSAAVYVYCPDIDRWDYACRPGSTDRLTLGVERTSFAMSILQNAPHADDGSAHLVVTGGVSASTVEPQLATTELLPLGHGSDASSGAERSEALTVSNKPGPGCTDRSRITTRITKSMPQSRSGCRSVVLWRSPQQRFLPWVSVSDTRHARPFVVIVGGESACMEDKDMCMTPAHEPAVLDLAKGEWHSNARDACDFTQASHRDATDVEAESQRHFFALVGKLRTSKVAFAMTVAPGIPLN